MTGRAIKSILFLNKQGFLTITTSSKSFCLSSDKIQHKLTKRQWLLKNGFHDHLPNFAKLPLPEEGNITILFHKCVTLSTFNKSAKLFGLLKHKTNNFQYIYDLQFKRSCFKLSFFTSGFSGHRRQTFWYPLLLERS